MPGSTMAGVGTGWAAGCFGWLGFASAVNQAPPKIESDARSGPYRCRPTIYHLPPAVLPAEESTNLLSGGRPATQPLAPTRCVRRLPTYLGRYLAQARLFSRQRTCDGDTDVNVVPYLQLSCHMGRVNVFLPTSGAFGGCGFW